MEVARCCREGLNLAKRLVEIGNVGLVSDVGVAAGLLEAALKGAELNVNINLKVIEDKNFVEEKNRVMSSLVRDRLKIKDEVLKKTEDRI